MPGLVISGQVGSSPIHSHHVESCPVASRPISPQARVYRSGQRGPCPSGLAGIRFSSTNRGGRERPQKVLCFWNATKYTDSRRFCNRDFPDSGKLLQALSASRVAVRRTAPLSRNPPKLLKLVSRNHPPLADFLPEPALPANLADSLGRNAQHFGRVVHRQKVKSRHAHGSQLYRQPKILQETSGGRSRAHST